MKYLFTIIILVGSLAAADARQGKGEGSAKKNPKISTAKVAKAAVATPEQTPWSNWGTVVHTAAPSYTITEDAEKIRIVIDTVRIRRFHDSHGTRQLACTTRSTIEFLKKTKDIKDEVSYLYGNYRLDGAPYARGPAVALTEPLNDPLFPAGPKGEITLLWMEEAAFRERYQNVLMPSLDNWSTIYDSGPEETLRKEASQIIRTTTRYQTKQAVWFGNILQLSYREQTVECFENTGNPGTHRITRSLTLIDNSALRVNGSMLTFSSGGNNYSVAIQGTIQEDGSASGAAKAGAAAAAPDLQYEDLSNPWHFRNQREFNRLYDELYWSLDARPVLTFTANYAACHAFRTSSIRESQFTHSTQEQARYNSESGRYGQMIDLHVGLTWRKTQTLYLAFMRLDGGFRSSSPTAVDWTTGIYGTKPAVNQRISLHGGAIGYNYSGYNSQQRVKAVFDAAIFYLYNEHPEDGMRSNQFGVRAAFGVSYRPSYPVEFHLMPTAIYNLSSLNRGTILRSNLYNIGITAGITYRRRRNN